MSELYARYGTSTAVFEVDHEREVGTCATQLNSVLLPVMRQQGLALDRSSVFEMGAGWGKNLLALRSLGAREVCGVDASVEQVALGSQLGLDSLKVIDPEGDLPAYAAGRTFDLFLLIDVLEHLSLSRLMQVAQAVHVMLRPGGLLVIQVPNDLAPLSPIRAGDFTHLRSFTGTSVVQFMRMCQIDPVLVRGIAFPGRGLTHSLRGLLTRYVVEPSVIGLGRVLYGRADPYATCAPNLFCVGRQPEHPNARGS